MKIIQAHILINVSTEEVMQMHHGNKNQELLIIKFMKKILLILIIFLFTSSIFAADEKPGRFFEDQLDITDNYQIHFNHLLAADSEDREIDINREME